MWYGLDPRRMKSLPHGVTALLSINATVRAGTSDEGRDRPRRCDRPAVPIRLTPVTTDVARPLHVSDHRRPGHRSDTKPLSARAKQ